MTADGTRVDETAASGANGSSAQRPRWVNWLFADRRTGQLVIAQFPNLPLWIFLGAVVARFVLAPSGFAGTALNAVADLALLWWAADEILRGVNPWRRFLGGTIAAFVLVSLIFGSGW